MATVTITNLTASPVYLGDLYASVPASGSMDIERTGSELDGMKSLQDAVLAAEVSVSVAYSAAEVAAGFTTPVQSVEPKDILPVAADGMTAGIVLRKAMVAGGGGSPDDVEIFAAGSLPFKMRVIDVIAVIATAVVASTVQVRDEAAGGGNLANTVASATTGRQIGAAPSDATVVLTPGATKGLFLRRSDDGAAGEVFVILRPES